MARLSAFFAELLILGFCLNIVLYLFGTFNVYPQVSFGYMNLSTWSGWFNLNGWNLLLAGGTAATIGLSALLLRSGTFAIYAMLLAALGMIITPVENFVTAIPNLIGNLIPAAANPTPGSLNPIVAVIDAIFVFAAFWFIFGLVIQRDV